MPCPPRYPRYAAVKPALEARCKELLADPHVSLLYVANIGLLFRSDSLKSNVHYPTKRNGSSAQTRAQFPSQCSNILRALAALTEWSEVAPCPALTQALGEAIAEGARRGDACFT